MNLFNWFDASAEKEFGQSLAKFFLTQMAPLSNFGDKAFAQKADKILHQMAAEVLQFKRSHKLNVFKKAQLGNAFKWTLHDAKLDPEYTDKLTKWLVIQMG